VSDVVIQVDNLAKKYRLGVFGTGTLRHDLNRWWHRFRGKSDPYAKIGKDSMAEAGNRKSPAKDLNSQKNGTDRHLSDTESMEGEMWALQNVSFEVKKGEIVGIIGRNGAGKSTLLKIISRVTAPTSGEVRLKGHIASLLEVGTGFHQELTGRENIFLNGTILGMKKSEIQKKLDEIVAFAEVGRYLDTPVKRYSSGMYVRLAFAVAAHLEPEILIVDEVLAVGDAEFQKKCLGKMKDVAGQGRTIFFVSHNMDAIRNLCQRGIWLKNGQLNGDGPSAEIVDSYFNSATDKNSFSFSSASYGLTIEKVVLRNGDGNETNQFRPGDDLIVEISYNTQMRLEKPLLTLGVIGIHGSCFIANMLLDGATPKILDGAGVIACRFKAIPLLPQNYSINLGIRTGNGIDWIMDYTEVAGFRVTANLVDYGYKGQFLDRASRATSVAVPYEWRLPDGANVQVSLTGSRQ
jgi:lipopolysaccharide transport system ATP-binding protein